MMRRWLAGVLAVSVLPAPLHSAPPTVLPPVARTKADPSLQRLRQRDVQLFAAGWRLAVANAPFCANARPALGLAVLDAGGFASPAAVRAQLGLHGDFAVGAVGEGSPTRVAGLRPDDTLLALNGESLAARFPPRKPAWRRLIAVTAALDTAAQTGPVTLSAVSPQGPARLVTLTPVSACPTRFEVLDRGGRASADGTRVILGRDFVGFGYPPDEFTAAVAHELAHNLLGHRASLDRLGRSLGNQRASEREADRLMPWLLANAGVDPEAAIRFMERWGPGNDGGLLRNRTHEGWDERTAAIRAETALVKAAMAADRGRADWAARFRRETLR